MFQKINKILQQSLFDILKIDRSNEIFLSQPPNHIDHQYHASSNIAMKYKPSDLSQIQFANILKDYFIKNYSDIFKKVEIMNPAFLNFQLTDFYVNEYLKDLHQNSLKNIFASLSDKKYDCNLEFVSCNPTGPMHIGHLRGTILGDCIAELLKSINCSVEKEFYINDDGNQINNFVLSIFSAYYKILNLQIFINIDEKNFYPGDYIRDIAIKIIDKYGKDFIHSNQENFIEIRNFSINLLMDNIKYTLKSCNVEHDVFTSEKEILKDNYLLQKLLKILKEKDLIYYGNIEKPVHINEKKSNITNEDKLIFKSNLFGEDKDCVMQKSNGEFTYFAKDAAYAYYKYQKSKNLIVLLGIDHKGHEKKMKAIFNAISNNDGSFRIVFCDLVKFVKDGQEFRLSKRGGNLILVDDILKIIDLDVLRFMMLYQKSNTTLFLDLTLLEKESSENPVFYVKYAYTRCISLLKEVKILDINLLNSNDYPPEYHKIITHLFFLENTLSKAIQELDLHLIILYIMKLSELLHFLWNLGGKDLKLKFIQKENYKLTENNLILINCVKNTIECLLKILKIKNFIL